MGVHHPFRLRSRPRGIRDSDDTLFITSLGLESVPAMTPSIDVVLQAFQNGIIKRATQLALCSICISVDDKRDARFLLSKRLQKRQVLLVDNNHLGIGVLEYIRNILCFEPIIYRYQAI